MRILVTDGMDKTAMALLREDGHEVVEQFYEPDQLGEALRDFDVAVVRSKTKVRAAQIDAAKVGTDVQLNTTADGVTATGGGSFVVTETDEAASGGIVRGYFRAAAGAGG